ncbi:MAG: ECF transporter S component [Clostridia bacterium]|nr:ECF transporter S component [Clostridia bacterium]
MTRGNKKQGHTDTLRLTYSALYLAIAMVLPLITGQIPEIGKALCPMHIPALLCGFVCGWPWGLAVGLIAPVMRSVIFGMPAMVPGAVAMSFELAVYGGVAGWLHSRLSDKPGMIWAELLAAMILGRVVWGAARLVIAGVTGNAFTWALFISGAITTAVPGIILQLVLIPILVIAMERAGLSLNSGKRKNME